MRYYAADLVSGPQVETARRNGWGNLTGPHRPVPLRLPGGLALDNGAWKVRGQEEGAWSAQFETAWKAAIWRDWRILDFVVLPDIVAGGPRSLEVSLSWLRWTATKVRQVLIAVQDGIEASEVAPHLRPGVGLAVGGSTEFKWATMETWASLGREKRVWTHVLRVNTQKKLRRCIAAGVTSADGSGVSQFNDHALVMEGWIQAGKLPVMADPTPLVGGRRLLQAARGTNPVSTQQTLW